MHRGLIAGLALAVAICALLAGHLPAQVDVREQKHPVDEAAGKDALSEKPGGVLPVREISVFKDGHAYMVHEGKMPVTDGEVVLDSLPTPVMGTFWPYSADDKVKLQSVTATQRVVSLGSTAISLREMLEANIGADVTIREDNNKEYDATILDIPARSSEELARTAAPGTPPSLPVKGDIIMLKRADGVKTVNIGRIQDVTFKSPPKTKAANSTFRNCLRLKLDWGNGKPGETASVGMIYVQKGIRWIPSYKIEIDGAGKAKVKMEATLINEMVDFSDVTVNMVIGVPSFAMKDVNDPIALQQSLTQLSQYFNPEGALGGQRLSNAMMTQVAGNSSMVYDRSAVAATAMDLGPAIPDSQKLEDLFVFTIQHVTLKKGQRMVLPVAEFETKYRDVYTLDIPPGPPQEVWRSMGNPQQLELAKMLNQPKVMHKIRLANASKSPFTTAPAMILKGGKPLAQGLMLYTPPSAETDLDLTPAIDIGVKKTEQEVKRTPSAANWAGYEYARVDLEGSIKLAGRMKEAVEIEVTREVVGNIEKADSDGKVTMLNTLEDDSYVGRSWHQPYWWSWYSWPSWWSHFNGIGKATWKVKLEPGKEVELKYWWNYYWR